MSTTLLHRGNRASRERVSRRLRLTVRLTSGKLDRQIAAGRPYKSTAALALRSSQLVAPGMRWQLAQRLRKIVDYADYRATHVVVSSVVVEPVAVRRARHPILGLAERLEGDDPVSPVGIVRAKEMLTDGLSPLYNRHSGQSVTQAIWAVQDALETRSGSR
jgi:hypothetical protein